MWDISYSFKIKPCMAAYSVRSRTGQRESRDVLSYYIVKPRVGCIVINAEIRATDSQSYWRILLK